MINKICLNCSEPFTCHHNKARFCSMSCAGKYNGKNKKFSEKHKSNISAGLKRKYESNSYNKSVGESHSKAVGKYTKGKYKNNPNSILDLSSRTVSKIIKRMNIGCSRCDWNEATCDIHHINGRKISDANNHKNLTYICPNCHRMVHEGKIEKSSLINLIDYIGDSWKEFYYG